MGTYRGLKIAGASTNLFKLSRTSKNQTVTLVSGTVYTASVRGKAGTISLSGATTGTVSEGSPLTFTAASTTLTVTVTGYLKHIQVEPGEFASQEVWTRNTSATRAIDSPAPIAGLQAGGKLGTQAGALIVSLDRAVSNAAASPFLSLIKAGETAAQNSIQLLSNVKGTGQLRLRIFLNTVMTERIYTSFNLLTGGRIGLSWSATELKIFRNGVLLDTIATQIPSNLDILSYQAANNEIIYKGVYLFNKRPLDANMIASTT